MKKIYGLFIAVFIAIIGLFTYDYVRPTWKDIVEIDSAYVVESIETDSLKYIYVDSTLSDLDTVNIN